MNNWLWSLPIVSGICGVLIALFARKQIMKGLPKIINSVFSISQEAPAAFEQMRPLVETKIDEFLRVKLPQSMPMISMFVGDKTINQLKTVFMSELELIFPEVIGDYSAGLLPLIENRMMMIAQKALSRLLFYGLLAGLATGLIQLLILTCAHV